MHTTGKHHNVFYVCASNIYCLLHSLDNGDEPWRTFKQLQPVYHSAGSSPPCSLCLEPPYGLMVKCY